MKKVLITLLACIIILTGCTSDNEAYEYTKVETYTQDEKKQDIYHNKEQTSFMIPAGGITYNLYLDCSDDRTKLTYQMYDEDGRMYSSGPLHCGETTTTDVTPSAGSITFTLNGYSEDFVNSMKKDVVGDTELDDLDDPVIVAHVQIESTQEMEIYYRDVVKGRDDCVRKTGSTQEEMYDSWAEEISCDEVNYEGTPVDATDEPDSEE